MSEFNRDVFNRLGICFDSEAAAEDFAACLQEELEERIGAAISEGMSRKTLDEFELIEDEEQAQVWLETNRPDYNDIVFKITAEVRGELWCTDLKFRG